MPGSVGRDHAEGGKHLILQDQNSSSGRLYLSAGEGGNYPVNQSGLGHFLNINKIKELQKHGWNSIEVKTTSQRLILSVVKGKKVTVNKIESSFAPAKVIE